MESPTGKSTVPTQPAEAASPWQVALVLGDANLLGEILLGVDSPSLARATAVSKLWLKTAAEPEFLRRFRVRHPPALLGFYVTPFDAPMTSFVPMPEELAAVAGHASFDLGLSCRNGRVVTGGGHPRSEEAYAVRRLLPVPPNVGRRPPTALPWPPLQAEGSSAITLGHAVLLAEGDGDVPCVAVTLRSTDTDRQGVWVEVRHFLAGEGAWGEERTSNTMQLPEWFAGAIDNFCMLSQGKAYMIGMRRHILVLDLASMHLSFIRLPDGVEYQMRATSLCLSRAEGSAGSLYLVHVDGLELSVWLYDATDSSGRGSGWTLVDTVDLLQAFGHLADPSGLSTGAVCRVSAVGDNADFAFLQVWHQIFHLHVSSRQVKKVYQVTSTERDIYVYLGLTIKVDPVMTISPPTSFRVPRCVVDQVH